MPKITPQLKQLIAKTKLEILPEDYFVIRLALDAKPLPGEWYRPATTRFAAFIREPKAISLIVARRKWLRMQSIFDKYEVSGAMKVVAFDTQLSKATCGYIAVIAGVLAEAEICAIPVCTAARDHIVVEKKELPRTVKILHAFIRSCGPRK